MLAQGKEKFKSPLRITFDPQIPTVSQPLFGIEGGGTIEKFTRLG